MGARGGEGVGGLGAGAGCQNLKVTMVFTTLHARLLNASLRGLARLDIENVFRTGQYF